MRSATMRLARGIAPLLAFALSMGIVLAQEPPKTEEESLWGDAPVPDWAKIPAYVRPRPDPAAVERGHSLFVANGCSFCHGEDARGGNGGPNLMRSQIVLSDRKGELIKSPIQKGVAGSAMAAFALSDAQVADVAEYLHSFDPSGNDAKSLKRVEFAMGNAEAGQRYFSRHCTRCHSASGDLLGIAARLPQPRTLQQRWLMPRTTTPTRVTVTRTDGGTLTGELLRMDEFELTVKLADGSERTIERHGNLPKLRIDSPTAAHRALLPTYRDDDIHDVTAYLASLK